MQRDTPRLPPRWRSLVWRSRFVVAALCCGAAASLAVETLRPPEPDVEHVVVTAREVVGGAALTADDLTTAPVPAELTADGLLVEADDLVGRTVPVALPAGVPVHRGLVPVDGTRVPEGRVVVAVRLQESSWLRPGDHVDLFAADDDGTRLARRGTVLPSGVEPSDDASGLLQGTTGTPDSPATLVAVDPEEAAAVSTATTSGWSGVVAVLVP